MSFAKGLLPGVVWCPRCGGGPYRTLKDYSRGPGEEPELPPVGAVLYLESCCGCFVEVVEDGLKELSDEEGKRRGMEQLLGRGLV